MALDGEQNQPESLSGKARHSTLVRIEDDYSLHSVRKAVLGRAELLGMPTRDLDELEIIVRELVSNVLNHGGKRGFMRISHDLDENDILLHLDVVDYGPGFQDFSKALEDGFSTTGSMGGGLSSIRRLSESVKLIRTTSEGSHLRVSKRFRVTEEDRDRWSFALYSRPYPGEKIIGDQGTLIRSKNSLLLILADGLGHGEQAWKASSKAIELAQMNHMVPIEELIALIHDQLRKTRGAAVSLARLPLDTEMVEWIGVGNVTGRLFRSTKRGEIEQQVFANFNGTLGVLLGSYRIIRYPYTPGDWLMLSTDGLKRSWMDVAGSLRGANPHSLGQRLVAKAARQKDDCSVLIGHSLA
jgi:anti-sigma regulatory factor (Ser/Thr protein kinase)